MAPNEMAERSIDRMSQYNSVITSTCTDKETQGLIRIANKQEELIFRLISILRVTEPFYSHYLPLLQTHPPSRSRRSLSSLSHPISGSVVLVNGSKKFYKKTSN